MNAVPTLKGLNDSPRGFYELVMLLRVVMSACSRMEGRLLLRACISGDYGKLFTSWVLRVGYAVEGFHVGACGRTVRSTTINDSPRGFSE